MNLFILFSLFTTILARSARNAEDWSNCITEFNAGNIRLELKNGKHLVRFYASWCGECSAFTSKWCEVGDSVKDSCIKIAQIDCAKYKTMCSFYNIRTYPSYLLFDNGNLETVYKGYNKVESFVSLVEGNCKERSKREVTSESDPILEYNSETFKKAIETDLNLVMFLAPWCKYAQKLIPIFKQLHHHYQDNSKIKIGLVDCTKDDTKDACFTEVHGGVPDVTLYMGTTKVEDYRGDTFEELQDLIDSHFNPDQLEGWNEREKQRKKVRKAEKAAAKKADQEQEHEHN